MVLLPARMSRREEDHWVATMLERLERRARRVVPGDAELERRARPAGPPLPGGPGRAALGPLWGTCGPVRLLHPDDGTIRLSDRLAPGRRGSATTCSSTSFAHLAVPDHSPAFWRLVDRYPLSERARGFLIAKGMEEDGD